MNNLIQSIQQAGVVGTGDAGFPIYKKIDARVEIVIANGADYIHNKGLLVNKVVIPQPREEILRDKI